MRLLRDRYDPKDVTNLSLSYYGIYEPEEHSLTSTEEIVRFFINLPEGLKTLSLHNCGFLCSQTSEGIAQILASIPTSVETLTLSSNNLFSEIRNDTHNTIEHIRVLLQGIQGNIKHLSLVDNNLWYDRTAGDVWRFSNRIERIASILSCIPISVETVRVTSYETGDIEHIIDQDLADILSRTAKHAARLALFDLLYNHCFRRNIEYDFNMSQPMRNMLARIKTPLPRELYGMVFDFLGYPSLASEITSLKNLFLDHIDVIDEYIQGPQFRKRHEYYNECSDVSHNTSLIYAKGMKALLNQYRRFDKYTTNFKYLCDSSRLEPVDNPFQLALRP
jgi:phage terminase Nu1 subunit (DNA packaging protein)